jgi:hypothetical protein
LIIIRIQIIIRNSMKANTIRSIWIAVIVAITLLLSTSSSIAAASMEITTENCDYNSHQGGATLPLCCLTSDSPLSHCILTNTVDIRALHAYRLIPTKIIYLAWSKTDVTTGTSLNPKKLLQWIPTQELLPYCYTEYHCRNCLNSEILPQI